MTGSIRRKLLWIIPVLLILSAVAIAPRIKYLIERVSYARDQRAAEQLIHSLRARCPADFPPEIWERASAWTATAYANVCFSPGYVPQAELNRFTRDLRRKLEDPIDVETLDWVWRRLAETGDHGRQYVERYERSFRAELAAASINGD